MREGEVWRDLDGNVIAAVAQIHGGRVLLCRPGPDQSAEAAVGECRRLHNLRARPLMNRNGGQTYLRKRRF